MPSINIQGTIIDFPDSGSSPNWAQAVIEFAQAVESSLSGLAGPFDVSPQTLNIDAQNPGTNVDITNLTFPTSEVRSAFIRYAVYRSTTTNSAYESGSLEVVYNPNGPVNQKWEVVREYVGDGSITFSMTDVGQIRFSTSALAGLNHTGVITYTAQAILQNA